RPSRAPRSARPRMPATAFPIGDAAPGPGSRACAHPRPPGRGAGRRRKNGAGCPPTSGPFASPGRAWPALFQSPAAPPLTLPARVQGSGSQEPCQLSTAAGAGACAAARRARTIPARATPAPAGHDFDMSQDFHRYDVIVIGGGHAGTEAALAAARAGARTLLLTHSIDTVGAMSCNPAIGGIGKGHLVREIDALGGIMARAADAAGIQWRRLNAFKGPAVRATRAQADRSLYRAFIRRAVEHQPNLTVFQAAVDDLVIEPDGRGEVVRGAITNTGLRFDAPA